MNNVLTRRLIAFPLLLLLLLTTPACFLQTITGATFQAGNSLITTVKTDSILATCVNGGFGSSNVECTYFFFDENGIPIEVTSSAQLISEFGLLGVVIDPLIYQIPANATNITATYEDENGNTGDLVVLSGYRSIPIDIGRTLFADPGTIFVIAELPDGTVFEGVQFDFSLSFTQEETTPAPVTVKPMLALKYEGNGQVFYPPFMPCAQDMADVSAYSIDMATELQPITATPGIGGCDGETYPLIGFGVFACDFDNDDDVDADDIALQASVRNSPALPGDRLDANADGFIDLNDARQCATQCLQPICATVLKGVGNDMDIDFGWLGGVRP